MIQQFRNTHDERIYSVNTRQKKRFDKDYRELLLSELVLAVVANEMDHARILAEMVQEVEYGL